MRKQQIFKVMDNDTEIFRGTHNDIAKNIT